LRKNLLFLSLLAPFLFFGACSGTSIRKDLVLHPSFQPEQYQKLAVINLDPHLQMAEYAEAELVRKGYQVKEGFIVRQMLKNAGFTKEEALDGQALVKIADQLEVQGIVLCSVLEFSRFRDAFRLNIKMVDPTRGITVWAAQGNAEGKRGDKASELVKAVVIACLKDLPRAK
jgi:hypothetical protein